MKVDNWRTKDRRFWLHYMAFQFCHRIYVKFELIDNFNKRFVTRVDIPLSEIFEHKHKTLKKVLRYLNKKKYNYLQRKLI